MENWEKAKGTGQQENNPQEGKQIFRAASRRGPKTKEKASPVLTVQMALCGFLLVLVLAVRSFSPELFAALGSAYGRALTDGAALTGSGELFRFAEKICRACRRSCGARLRSWTAAPRQTPVLRPLSVWLRLAATAPRAANTRSPTRVISPL